MLLYRVVKPTDFGKSTEPASVPRVFDTLGQCASQRAGCIEEQVKRSLSYNRCTK